MSVAACGIKRVPGITIAGSVTPFSVTVAVWIAHTSYASSDQVLLWVGYGDTASDTNTIALELTATAAGKITAFCSGFTVAGGGNATITVTDSWADSKPHLYIATTTFSSTSIAQNLFVDGTQVGTSGVATTGSTLPLSFGCVQAGGALLPGPAYAITGNQASTTAHVAIWTRALSGGEIGDLVSAGAGYPGETTGARVARYLGYGYSGPTSIATGLSACGVSRLSAGTDQLSAIQDVTTTENGTFWADSAGTATFADRTSRYVATTVKWVFGEDQTGGEYPYEGDVSWDFDPTLVFNDISVTNDGTGTITRAQDYTSQADYFPRGLDQTINTTSALETVDRATYLLAGHKDPHPRVANVKFRPSGNPALWPMVLGVAIGDRVTVKRRTTVFTMAADYFVEQINHSAKNTGEWETVLQLSPAAQPNQPGIFDDATYGQFDNTFYFSY